MGWLSKIFKGSNHKVSEGRYDLRYGTDTLENDPSTSFDSWSEIEDIDHAIALSLSEEEKVKTFIDSEPQLEEDEQLARAFQESLNVEPPQQRQSRNDSDATNGYGHGNENIFQPISVPYSASFRNCAGCNTEIGHGRFLSRLSAMWHPECFRCHGCNQPIYDFEFMTPCAIEKSTLSRGKKWWSSDYR